MSVRTPSAHTRCHQRLIAVVSIGISSFLALCMPPLAIAQSGKALALVCLTDEICVTPPAGAIFKSLATTNPQSPALGRLLDGEPVYLIQSARVKAVHKSTQVLWFDLMQTIKRRRTPDNASITDRFTFATQSGMPAECRTLALNEGYNRQAVSYCLVQAPKAYVWLIAVPVARTRLERYREEIKALWESMVIREGKTQSAP